MVAGPGDSAAALRDVHIPSLPPNESFVYFDVAADFINRAIVKRQADTVIHEPCRLLGDAEIAGPFHKN